MSTNIVTIGKTTPASVLVELLNHPDGIDGMIVMCQTNKGEVVARFCNVDERTASYLLNLAGWSMYQHMNIDIEEG